MTPLSHDAPVRQLDHDWFPFRISTEATAPAAECSLIVSLVVVLQHFPIAAKAPFPLPGALDRPYPDLGNYTHRESGLGPALWRVTDEIEACGVPATIVVERQALPWLSDVDAVLRNPRHCVVAGGEHAVCVHSDDMGLAAERQIIFDCLRDVEAMAGRKVHGWRSPYCSQSRATLRLLAEAGLRYVGDFSNDDRPFEISAGGRSLLAVPMNHFYSDLHFVHACRQSVSEYASATIRAAEWLAAERHRAPAVLSLVVHPWIMGATHRVATFVGLLERLQEMPGIQFMNSDEISASTQSALGSAKR
ncbi:MAG: hypothetical protein ROZ64_08615 [Burkholderiaceae bacterium]|jgi:hypothetical protein|nr:hypothetical protein [Burkholderiaceae bacterium]